jgi:TonB family protein
LTVSLLLALAAWAFERAVRVFAFPKRWIWAGAMGGSLAYTVVAILWPPVVPLEAGAGTTLDALLAPVIGAITVFAVSSPVGAGFDPILGTVWAVLTLAAAAVLVRAHLRLRSDRSSWTHSEVDGRDVLVSDDLGPGVVGWIRSVIVMPRWALRMPRQERELMLRHEGEHCNAGDTRVAGLALLLLTLLPWNIPLWWQVRRLRLAIEIDCDHRVLQRSADVKRYARLLVEIGARGTASRLSALAFARPIPSIERRILAMTSPRHPRYLRTLGLTLLGALLVVASCQVEAPTTTAVGPPDVQAEQAVVSVQPTEAEPEVVEDTPPAVQEEPPADQAADVDAVEAAIAALPSPPEAFRQDLSEIEAEPVFTPMTVRPDILNRQEIQQALMREYPPPLRDAGIGGTVVVWFLISETGEVVQSRISEASGQDQLDAAALRVASAFRFTAATNRGDPVPVWIQLPITFQVL